MESTAADINAGTKPCPQCGTAVRFRVDHHTQRQACPQCGYVLPHRVSHFELKDIIGAGGMGAVYRGFDISLERNVAVKVMKEELARNQQFVENFLREARAAAALNHPNIAQIYSFGEENSRYYLVMELLPNGSLDDRIEKDHRLPEVEVLNIGIQVASGLRAAFERNLIHRDIKPGNILFGQDGSAKVVDFGLARFESPGSQSQQEEGIWGTPYYIAPEKVAESKEDFRSDIYSLGGTLFHALAGRAPFEAGTSTEVVLKHLRSPSVSLLAFAPDCTSQTADVIGRMLKRDPAERPQSYDEVLNDLAYAKRFAMEKKPTEAVEEKTEFSMPLLVGTLLMILICIGALVVFLINKEKFLGPDKSPLPPEVTNSNKPAPPASPIQLVKPPPKPSPAATNTVTPSDPKRPPPPPPSPMDYAREMEIAHELIGRGDYPQGQKRLADAEKNIPANHELSPWAKVHFSRIKIMLKQTDATPVLQGVAGSLNVESILSPMPANQFPQFLSLILLGKVSTDSFTKQLPSLPPWMQALARFDQGLSLLKPDRWDETIQVWQPYCQISRVEEKSWVLAFQPYASNLINEADSLKKLETQIAELKGQNKFDEIQKLLQEKSGDWKNAVIQDRVTKLNGDNKQALAAWQKAEKDKKDKELAQQMETEKKSILEKKSKIASLLASYQFDRLVAEWKNLEPLIKTDSNRKDMLNQINVGQILENFKAGLIQNVTTASYTRGGIVTRANHKMTGDLFKIDEQRLYFRQTDGGILACAWKDLPPSALIELGDFYLQKLIAEKQPNGPEIARRSIALAVLAREYSLPEKWVQGFYNIAKERNADIKDLLEKAKLPDSLQPVLLR